MTITNCQGHISELFVISEGRSEILAKILVNCRKRREFRWRKCHKIWREFRREFSCIKSHKIWPKFGWICWFCHWNCHWNRRKFKGIAQIFAIFYRKSSLSPIWISNSVPVTGSQKALPAHPFFRTPEYWLFSILSFHVYQHMVNVLVSLWACKCAS